MKSIEVASDLLMKQVSFAKHFLKMIGIAINDKNNVNIKHKQLGKKLDYFEDSFYRSFDEFDGLRVSNMSEKEGISILNGIVCVMMELLNKEVVINDSLLVLCLQYCNIIGSIDKTKKSIFNINRKAARTTTIGNDFIAAIIQCVKVYM